MKGERGEGGIGRQFECVACCCVVVALLSIKVITNAVFEFLHAWHLLAHRSLHSRSETVI